MNKEIWNKRYFTNKNPIDYSCPNCNIGILKIDNDKLLIKVKPGQEEMERYGYQNGIEYIFTAILVCKNNECGSVVSMTGDLQKDIRIGLELDNGEWVEDSISEYKPKFCHPPLRLIPIGKDVRKEVKEQLLLSFSHFYNDLSSCANRIRNCIELILDDLNAAKKYRNGVNVLRPFRTLHDRITNYQKSNKRIGNLLLAIKIIGNEGSHIGVVEVQDIIDAYEFLERILDHVYHKTEKDLHLRASEIVSRNKPRSK